MINVRFNRVGRGKVTWTASLPDTSPDTILREIRRSRTLLSQTVDYSGGATGGVITVGFGRTVGTWEVVGDAS